MSSRIELGGGEGEGGGCGFVACGIQLKDRVLGEGLAARLLGGWRR